MDAPTLLISCHEKPYYATKIPSCEMTLIVLREKDIFEKIEGADFSY